MISLQEYRLRNVEQRDINLIFEWRNADHIRPFMNNSEEIPFEAHNKWFQSLKGNKSRIVKLCLYREKPIGLVQFSKMDPIHKTCEWGFYIGDTTCPPGSGKAMGFLALDFIFHEVQMRKVNAQVLEFNSKSLSYHKKLGFYEEGRLLQQIVRNNQFYDLVLFGLFKEEWEKKKLGLRMEATNIYEGHSNWDKKNR
jgi:UDP-4-amino-4,6-dideoxy-N-acetyl-beta-L-altrosamine N-acetyltransferase